jgi:hypothetical protein
MEKRDTLRAGTQVLLQCESCLDLQFFSHILHQHADNAFTCDVTVERFCRALWFLLSQCTSEIPLMDDLMT